jgi:hypothetical protein
MVVQKEPAAPRKVNPAVPRDLETICLKCLEKDPDRRYPTAKDLADDLRRYVNRFAILAKRAGPLTRARKWVRRNRALSAALAGAGARLPALPGDRGTPPDRRDLFNSQLILRFLGRKREAEEVTRRFLAHPKLFPPVRKDVCQRELEYCAGLRSAQDLVDSMLGVRGDLSGAHLCIALPALADGDRVKAREHLERGAQTRYFENFPDDVSVMLLSRMDRDPNWPSWIPHVAPPPRPKP